MFFGHTREQRLHRPSIRHQAALLLLTLTLLLSLLPFSAEAQDAGQEPPSDPAKESLFEDDGDPSLPPGIEVITVPLPEDDLMVSGASIEALALTSGVRISESEPNNTPATAMALGGDSVWVRGNIFPAADADFYSFDALAGDRVYAATQTHFDASNINDSVLQLLASDGTTVIELDHDDGSFSGASSSIAGATIPSNGTYYLRVSHFIGTGTLRPYDLHFKLQRGAPVPEAESNNSVATASPLPASGWVSGNINAVSPEVDIFSLSLSAGDSVFLSLDLNPERDGNVWNGRLGFGLFGNPPANQVLLINDANNGADPNNPNSEAFFFTVLNGGTYYVYVDATASDGLGANATYHLSFAVYNPVPKAGLCTTHTNTTPLSIPSGPGMVTSSITVPGNPRIADLDVSINLNHAFMQDLDVLLVSPAGNRNALFTDVGPSTSGGAQTLMDIRLDDDAALPFWFPISAPMVLQPEADYRLGWFHGEEAGGLWTLVIYDDSATDGGNLNSWSLTICEPGPLGPPEIVLHTFDFEDGEQGFTHSGAQDEWEHGTPTTSATSTVNPVAAFNTCNSGVKCWKTDLDDTYDASSSQELLSPALDLTGQSGPIRLQWAMRYQLENASFERFVVEAREIGGSDVVRAFTWLDATMTVLVGNPGERIGQSAGWGVHSTDISALAGKNIEVRFHLQSDANLQLGGVTIDDVQILVASTPNLSLTKSVSPSVVAPGEAITYTLTISNTGDGTASGILLTDTLPFNLTNLNVIGSGAVITDTGASPAFVWQVEDLAPLQSATVTLAGTLDPLHSVAGIYTNTATIAATHDYTPTDNIASAPVTVLVPDVNVPAPDISVLGNGELIAIGSTTLSTSNHTDFGTVTLGQSVTRTFVIRNSGSANLTIGGVALHGAAANLFAQTGPTTPIVLAPAANVPFQVQFIPTSSGTVSATVAITNSVAGATPYTFAIQGRGMNSAPLANAGADQDVMGDSIVTLDGSASSDPDGHLPLTYSWVQSEGAAVTLNDAGAAKPTFTAPSTPGVLTFALVVTDAFAATSAADSVAVTVNVDEVDEPDTSWVHLPMIGNGAVAGE